MKKLLLILLFAIGVSFSSNAQNYSQGSYYASTGYIEDYCNGCWCYHAEWHQRYGTRYIQVWNGYMWVYVQQSGYYYWYTWNTYRNPYCY